MKSFFLSHLSCWMRSCPFLSFFPEFWKDQFWSAISFGYIYSQLFLLGSSPWIPINRGPNPNGRFGSSGFWVKAKESFHLFAIDAFEYWRVTRLPLINSWHHAASFLTSLSKCFFFGGKMIFLIFFVQALPYAKIGKVYNPKGDLLCSCDLHERAGDACP